MATNKDKFNKGFRVKTYQAVDLMNHMDYDNKLRGKEGIVPRSLRTDILVDWDEFEYKEIKDSGYAFTEDIILVSFDIQQKTGEEIRKEAGRKAKDKKADSAKYKKDLKKLKSEQEKIQKRYDALSKSKNKNSNGLTEKEWRKIAEDRLDINNKVALKEELIEKAEEDIKYYNNLAKDESFALRTSKRSREELRKDLYENGVKITKGDKIYKYQRITTTSSKARQGKAMFALNEVIDKETGEIIREKLADKWMDDCSLGLHSVFKKRAENGKAAKVVEEVYFSLDQSALIDGMYFDFNPDNMLVIPDVDALVKAPKAMRLFSNEKEKLCIEELVEAITKNTMWDGQMLADSSLFKGLDTSFALLREKMFKSCAFNTELVEYFKEYCKENGLDYDTIEVVDYFGRTMKLKDVKMITTENSTKFVKFAEDMFPGENKKTAQRKFFELWAEDVKKRGCKAGIVKTEHASAYGDLQKMSYQMFNSLPLGSTHEMTKENIKKILKEQKNVFNKMKDSNVEFVDWLEKNANEMNGYERVAALCRRNGEYTKTKEFKEFKSRVLNQLKADIESGRVLVEGDNNVMVSNPIEMMNHALNQNTAGHKVKGFNVEDGKLDKTDFINSFGNENGKRVKVWSKGKTYGQDFAAFRSPHSTDSSIVLMKNIHNPNAQNKLNKVMRNLGENVVVVDSTEFPLQDMLAGCDYDSDFVLMTSNDTIIDIVEEKSWLKKPITINNVGNSPATYLYNGEDLAKKDIAVAANHIGEIVNTGQIYQSHIQHLERTGGDEKAIKELKIIAAELDGLSGMAIDSAKRMPLLAGKGTKNGIEVALDKIKGSEYALRNEDGKILYPEFFKNISQDPNIGKKTQKMECNMDILKETVGEEFKNSAKEEALDINEMLDLGEWNNNVKLRLIEDFKEYGNKIKSCYAQKSGISKEEAKDIDRLIEQYTSELSAKIKKRMTNSTAKKNMSGLINAIYNGYSDSDRNARKFASLIQDAMYKLNPEAYLSCFVKGEGIPVKDSLVKEADEMLDKVLEKAQETINDVVEYHDAMHKSLNERMDKVYYNAIKGMNEKERMKWLNGKMSIEEQKALGLDAYNARLKRLDALKDEVDRVCGIARDKTNEAYTRLLDSVVRDSYKNTTFTKIDDNLVKKIMDEPLYGKRFWERNESIYNTHAKLLKDTIAPGLITGESSASITRKVKELGMHSNYAANRLVRTESAYFHNQALLQAYKDMGVEKYVYVSTLDKRTSLACRKMDGLAFRLDEAVVGENFPPLHPHCRSTVIRYWDDEVLEDMDRTYRDKSGKNRKGNYQTYTQYESDSERGNE